MSRVRARDMSRRDGWSLRGGVAVARRRVVAAELVAAADHVLQPAARLGPRDRVEEDPERDARDQQRRVAAGVLLLALEPVGGAPQVVHGILEPVADVVVGRDARGERDGAAAADELVVEG